MPWITGEKIISPPAWEVVDFVADERTESVYNPDLLRSRLGWTWHVQPRRLALIPARAVGAVGRLLTSTSLALTALVTLTCVAACGSGRPVAGPSPTQPAKASAPLATTPAAACDTGAWQSAPVSASGQATAPGVPVLTAVRAAQHPECGYDRIVLDITGPLPGYAIRYVSQVTADPSGQVISLPGSHFLLITLHPADMHTSAGIPTITGTVRVLNYPMLAGWSPAGDFEAYVTVAVGLNARTQIRVGELPGRLYIDVRE